MIARIGALGGLALLVAACGGDAVANEAASDAVAPDAVVANEMATGAVFANDLSEAAAPVETAAAPAAKASADVPTDAWIGKWVGVEGLALDVVRGSAPGTYLLTIHNMDGSSDHVGRADGNVIRFTRNGEETIRRATGEQTGLKWLDGMTNCLMIQEGEGFCRE